MMPLQGTSSTIVVLALLLLGKPSLTPVGAEYGSHGHLLAPRYCYSSTEAEYSSLCPRRLVKRAAPPAPSPPLDPKQATPGTPPLPASSPPPPPLPPVPGKLNSKAPKDAEGAKVQPPGKIKGKSPPAAGKPPSIARPTPTAATPNPKGRDAKAKRLRRQARKAAALGTGQARVGAKKVIPLGGKPAVGKPPAVVKGGTPSTKLLAAKKGLPKAGGLVGQKPPIARVAPKTLVAAKAALRPVGVKGVPPGKQPVSPLTKSVAALAKKLPIAPRGKPPLPPAGKLPVGSKSRSLLVKPVPARLGAPVNPAALAAAKAKLKPSTAVAAVLATKAATALRTKGLLAKKPTPPIKSPATAAPLGSKGLPVGKARLPAAAAVKGVLPAARGIKSMLRAVAGLKAKLPLGLKPKPGLPTAAAALKAKNLPLNALAVASQKKGLLGKLATALGKSPLKVPKVGAAGKVGVLAAASVPAIMAVGKLGKILKLGKEPSVMLKAQEAQKAAAQRQAFELTSAQKDVTTASSGFQLAATQQAANTALVTSDSNLLAATKDPVQAAAIATKLQHEKENAVNMQNNADGADLSKQLALNLLNQKQSSQTMQQNQKLLATAKGPQRQALLSAIQNSQAQGATSAKNAAVYKNLLDPNPQYQMDANTAVAQSTTANQSLDGYRGAQFNDAVALKSAATPTAAAALQQKLASDTAKGDAQGQAAINADLQSKVLTANAQQQKDATNVARYQDLYNRSSGTRTTELQQAIAANQQQLVGDTQTAANWKALASNDSPQAQAAAQATNAYQVAAKAQAANQANVDKVAKALPMLAPAKAAVAAQQLATANQSLKENAVNIQNLSNQQQLAAVTAQQVATQHVIDRDKVLWQTSQGNEKGSLQLQIDQNTGSQAGIAKNVALAQYANMNVQQKANTDYNNSVNAKNASANQLKVLQGQMKGLKGADKAAMQAQVNTMKQFSINDKNMADQNWKAKGTQDAIVSQQQLDAANQKVDTLKAQGADKATLKAAEKDAKGLDAFNKDNQCRSRGEQKCCGTVWCKAGTFFKKAGGKIVHVAAEIGHWALQGIAAIANAIPILGAPFAMAAKAADIGVQGVVAGTKDGFDHFGHNIGSYFKDQATHGGLEADIAGAAAEIIPGGDEAGKALKAATMVVKGVQKGGNAAQSATGS